MTIKNFLIFSPFLRAELFLTLFYKEDLYLYVAYFYTSLPFLILRILLAQKNLFAFPTPSERHKFSFEKMPHLRGG